MATLDTRAPSSPPDPSGDVTYTASVDLNLSWRQSGYVVEVCRSKGNALPAGSEFTIPAAVADEFEKHFGPRPGAAGVSVAARQDGIIPGLRRVQS